MRKCVQIKPRALVFVVETDRSVVLRCLLTSGHRIDILLKTRERDVGRCRESGHKRHFIGKMTFLAHIQTSPVRAGFLSLRFLKSPVVSFSKMPFHILTVKISVSLIIPSIVTSG
ncbi:hypothetical protein NPIL_564541 [Nephila pilipes]|uniref:Uncharacterized protein n=1 Tax=Nephila pilipes TaxID=299642 RepID=A0A8X6PMJ8_NEPPI|nr:hypothetical protein NPIL_564541 [Nephila pilipes]